MKQTIYCLLITLLYLPVHGQPEGNSLLGAAVPDSIQFKKILNYEKQNAQLSDYHGKTVILDFWATWCAPCIKAFPKLQALEERFAGQLRVFTVTSTDTEARIQRFLQKFDTDLPIVMDDDGQLKRLFPHSSVPHTVVIDKDGIVRAVTSGRNITEQLVSDVINGVPLNLEEKKDRRNWDQNNHFSAESSIFQLTITPYEPNASAMILHPNEERFGRYAFFNLPLWSIHQELQGFSVFRTLYEVDNEYKTIMELREDSKYRSKPEDSYCLEVIAPRMSLKEMRSSALDFVRRNFDLQSEIITRRTKVKVLQRTDGPLKLKAGSPALEKNSVRSGAGVFEYNQPVALIARYLEGFSIAGMPVVDETGLNGKYDIEIPFYAEDPQSFYQSLNELGLQVVEAEREIEFLVLFEKKRSHP